LKAIVFDGAPGRCRLAADYPEPNPPSGEARVRTTLAGICNTDLEIVKGYAGFQGVLGHEFVGVVEETPDSALLGRRVVGEINAYCGTCETCRSGLKTHCPNRTTLGIRQRDGALAEAFCLPVRNLHPVPAQMADEVAVFAEPLAAACEILSQVQVRPNDRVAVLGDGKLGLLIAQVLALTGCDLTVVGKHENKLSILAARGIGTQIGAQRSARSFDLVVECTGRAEGFQAARRLVRPRGTLVLKSTYPGSTAVDLSGLVVDEIRIVGSRCGPFPAALRLLSRGLVDVTPLIEAEYPLDDGLAAFEHAARPGALKVLVRP
jgi:threonine dehydrogenase-like Zn-dependent dehydrogenase